MSSASAVEQTVLANDDAAIRATIGKYEAGMRAGSIDTLRSAFHEQAIMSGYLGDQLMIVPIQGLYDFVASNPAPAASGEPFGVEVRSIHVAGNTAVAVIAEHSYLGFEFIDSFQMLKIDGQWTIISKVFTTVAG